MLCRHQLVLGESPSVGAVRVDASEQFGISARIAMAIAWASERLFSLVTSGKGASEADVNERGSESSPFLLSARVIGCQ